VTYDVSSGTLLTCCLCAGVNGLCCVVNSPVSVSVQVIDPGKSRVNLMGTKVEVNLKKMEPGSWSSLESTVPPTSSADGDS